MPSPGRITGERWIDEGIAVLRALGEGALTIERLCANLRRTKGSFYHHFADLSVYLDALLARWEARDTDAIIRAADVAAGVEDRRTLLEAAVHRVDTDLDVAVRAWGLRDPRARAFVQRVDERRMGYLAQLYRAQGVSAPLAQRLARVEYAAFVGRTALWPAAHPKQKRAAANVASGAAGRGRACVCDGSA